MDQGSDRRVKPAISYAESEGSENPSPFNTPPSQRVVINLDEVDTEEDEDDIQFTTARLRQRRPNQSLKFLENGETKVKRSHKKKSIIDEVCSIVLRSSHLMSCSTIPAQPACLFEVASGV